MAKVLSSISGNLISAASAGFAPTNSADVSAIASAYQVVSATGTQLYAGTAHVTSINSAPISASRAGNAANASLATSAWYDGTGRLISALPDAAEVSAIASAYADDKLDKTAQVVTATAGDGTYVTSINGRGISGQGGGGAQVVTSTGSASATEGYWPYTTSYLVSSINGSGLLPYGFSAVSANSATWNATRTTVQTNSANWNSVYNTVSSNSASWSGSTGGGSVTSPSGTIVVMNDNEIEGTNSAVLTASAGDGFLSELTPVRNYIDNSWFRLYDGILPASGATLTLHTDPIWGSNVYFSGKKLDGTISLFDVSASGGNGATSLTVDLGEIAREISAYATTYVGINGKMTAEKVGGIQVTGVGELAWKSAVDNVTNTVSSNSATWGQGGVDSATVSSIASSYAQSAVSSKADSSALSSYALSADVSGVINTVASNSASWETTLPISASNGTESAKYSMWGADIVDRKRTAYIDPQTMRLESAADPSDPASYVTAELKPAYLTFKNSASTATVDISSIQKWTSAVDTVSSNSASWGAGGPVTATASAKATAYTSTSTYVAFTGISSVNGSALLVSNMLPNTQQATGNAHFHYMPTTSPWGSTEYTGLLSPLQYATGAALAMKHSNQYGAYYKGNEWFISDVSTSEVANGVVRAELHRTRGIHLYGSSLDSSIGFHLNGAGINGQSGTSAWQYGPTEYNMLTAVNDTVSTQSANWGGSALALSAGPGVKLEKVGNTLVAGLDETVLWSGETTSITGITLNESYANFDRVRFYWNPWTDTMSWQVTDIPGIVSYFNLSCGWANNSQRAFFVYEFSSTNHLNFSQVNGAFTNITGTAWATATACKVYKVVGVNRTAGV